jgi:hypothetical protein
MAERSGLRREAELHGAGPEPIFSAQTETKRRKPRVGVRHA